MSREQRVTQRKLNQSRKKLNTISKGYPSANEGHDGQETIRWVDGKGLFYFVKYNGTWYSHQFNQTPSVSDPKQFADTNLIYADGSKNFTGNQSHGGNSISGVNDLDVNGHATLDKTTIDTADGELSVSGSNNVNITPEADITLQSKGATSAPKDIKAIGGKSDFTKYGDLSLESYNKITESGTEAANYNANGIHVIADSQGDTSGKHNNIFIEQKNTHTKGNSVGIDIKSSNGLKLRAESLVGGSTPPSGILMRGTAHIDMGGGTSSITPTSDANYRVKVHGKFEAETLYRPDDTPINCSTHSVTFDQLDTQKLMRNFTYTHKTLNVTNGTTVEILADSNLESTVGTTYRIIVGAYTGSNELINCAYAMRLYDGTFKIAHLARTTDFSTNYGTIAAVSGAGITWNNNTGQTVHVYATIQRIVESSDY